MAPTSHDINSIRADGANELASPEQLPPELFRRAMRSFATGVALITANTSDGPVGMAINSLTSLSLSPALLLLCPAKSSTTWPAIRSVGKFCVSVMGAGHQELIARFATRDIDRFAGSQTVQRPWGPAFVDAAAWIDCTVVAEHDGGDHTIVVAAVSDVDAREGVEPLVFCGGEYGGFARGKHVVSD